MRLRSEPILAGLTLVMLAVIISTARASMSEMTSMTILGVFAFFLFSYLLFIYRERPADERERSISLNTGKYSYIVGSLILTAGILVQSIDHDLDIWLPIALAAMVITKLAGLYSANR